MNEQQTWEFEKLKAIMEQLRVKCARVDSRGYSFGRTFVQLLGDGTLQLNVREGSFQLLLTKRGALYHQTGDAPKVNLRQYPSAMKDLLAQLLFCTYTGGLVTAQRRYRGSNVCFGSTINDRL